LSNLTGRWITKDEATDPTYWANHIRATVRFADNLTELLANEYAVLLELGPGQALTRLARQHPACNSRHVIVSSLRHPEQLQDDMSVMLSALGQLWLAGMEPDWDEFYKKERRRRVSLPTYPFDRRQYWIEPVDRNKDLRRAGAGSDRETHTIESPLPEIYKVKSYPRPELSTAYVSPDSDRERLIAEIWQKALGVEKIGVLDNFFDLGGDSLLAIQTATELKNAFQVDIPIVSIYEGLTVRSLARLLEDLTKERRTSEAENAEGSELNNGKISRRHILQQQQRARRSNRAENFQ